MSIPSLFHEEIHSILTVGRNSTRKLYQGETVLSRTPSIPLKAGRLPPTACDTPFTPAARQTSTLQARLPPAHLHFVVQIYDQNWSGKIKGHVLVGLSDTAHEGSGWQIPSKAPGFTTGLTALQCGPKADLSRSYTCTNDNDKRKHGSFVSSTTQNKNMNMLPWSG